MKKNLVIVESPAKAKTIAKVLGEEYLVTSSFGHIRDLSKKKLGIDLDQGFTPLYVIPPDKKELIKKLTKAAADASIVWLASDEDREGEAIAWHLKETLNIPDEKTRRIAFHEITKDAILQAIANPRDIDMNLVMAQQARRVLDRLVGYEVSPILWKKVKPRLSAGRVQSVALRLVVERERDILKFVSSSSFRIEGHFSCPARNTDPFRAELDTRFRTADQAEDFLKSLVGAHYTVTDIEKKKGRKSPAPPFTTSTLQQEASRKLGFSVSQTMSVAQRLYESGRITYMRTDSTQLSKIALASAKKMITGSFGSEYSKTRQYATRTKGAQEAHEAIRPTFMEQNSIEGTALEKKLYDLIWKRTLASQMSDAQVDKTRIVITDGRNSGSFTATGEVVTFDGFLKVYRESSDDDQEKNNGKQSATLPYLEKGDSMDASQIKAVERFAQSPFRYTEASLVKKLEELGIGRPSTYAPTISTIIQRQYVVKGDRPAKKRKYTEILLEGDKVTRKECKENYGEERGKLFPEDIGILVNDFLMEHFPSIVDYNFTARAEEDFDLIATGKLVWNKMLEDFYKPFRETLDQALKTSRPGNGERFLGNDPVTGKPVTVRLGKFGAMAQMGNSDDPEKRYAGLQKGQLLESITLEEALQLFRLPRELGQYKDLPVIVSTGRFGPYVKWQGKYVSLSKTDDPYTITSERSIELIEQAVAQDAKKHILEFPGQDIRVLKGRYGPYINHNKKNYRIPKGTDPESLTLEDCRNLIQKKDNE
ncbi:MAG: type I DNA topoisomerase [Bacteroidales bacterium]|jgi:DNA topoisomerase-1|nr:type I DNA topoisomerase [Bacteroidales bacterium]MDD2263498.1 type I DNA topoisomerase [Bacteroidales bacterium]MDD2830712.1 type I DNA topoisomerase [Bacteroidales bacterium]MDD3207911.1 type I DNA topoisomerase [Bacteroidales bacterium]MDD3696582.1 type I DNA topoisomerase [Bacteroidales bacterium]